MVQNFPLAKGVQIIEVEAAKNARRRQKSSSITVSSTAGAATKEGDRDRIDMLLTKLYNHEPGSYVAVPPDY